MKKVLKIINLLLFVITLIFSYHIFLKKDFNFSLLQQTYKTMSNHFNINKYDVSVSNAYNYIKVGDYKYKNDSYHIYSPYNGVITYKGQNSLIINLENDYKVIFKNIININVNKYDVITVNDQLANFVDYFYMYFVNGETIYSYEEILKNN